MNEHKPKQLNIKDAEAYQLAKEIAEDSGVNLTTAVLQALREKAAKVRKEKTREERVAALLEHGRQYAKLADRDTRTADEIIGYDEYGIPR